MDYLAILQPVDAPIATRIFLGDLVSLETTEALLIETRGQRKCPNNIGEIKGRGPPPLILDI